MDCRRVSAGAPLADQVWALLLHLSFERVHRHFDATAAELGLSTTQAMALHELDAERSLSMRELARRLDSDPSMITGLIDRLASRGLAERQPDPRDRRITGVALTRAGAQLRERLVSRVYAAPRSIACLAPADLRALHALLARVADGCGPPEQR